MGIFSLAIAIAIFINYCVAMGILSLAIAIAIFINYCVAIARLHGAMTKFANRKIARIFRVFNLHVSAFFSKTLHCQSKT